MIDILKALFLGVIEGFTEWLPISSTGHLILADEFIQLGASDAFKEMFDVVIQFGAIIAVIVLFWNKLWPFCWKSEEHGIDRFCKRDTWTMWFKVLVAMLPAAIIGIPLDDWFDEHFHNPTVVSIALIVYGIIFIVMEYAYKDKRFAIRSLSRMTYPVALGIGAFQVLSLIPGTSRSGSTIIGAMLLGCSRTVSAEFTFFLAIPVMAGASLIKLLKFGLAFTGTEVILLAVGMISAFVVSLLSIKWLMGYVRKHDFKIFGWYRIVLGVIVLVYFYVVK
ncbi:MAG: undecaprenyl-diphosphate phosphatase [Clostridia bacterium]|nr:undecaprenyl-diphosphate phosphatase [Clostridia bacterium]NLS85163.1 undecaprenyl-diphosphate phosphatase [Oscillospiraceae bacterium]